MTREQGILKTYTGNNLSILTPEIATKLVQTEYKNYTELCEYCGEQPKTITEWTKETIKPLKK
jgi:hypothetical protein